MEVRVEEEQAGGVSVHAGALLFALDLAAAPSPANVPIQLHALAVACHRVVAGVKGAASGSGGGGGDEADVAKAAIASTPHGAPLAALR